MEGKIKGKQIADGTVVKSLNGSPDSTQYLIPSSDSNITLDIVTPLDSSTHSFVVGWQGHLPLERGGLNNSDFSESEILITKTSSVILKLSKSKSSEKRLLPCTIRKHVPPKKQN